MALSSLLYITQDYSTGDLVRIDEITGLYSVDNTGGYGAPNPSMSAINKTRFLFSSYVTESTADQNITECLANVEYVVNGTGSNTVVVDTKEFVLGDIFVLRADATPVIGDGLTLAQTGRYGYVPTFLPADIYLEVSPSEFGLSDLIFPDSSYKTTYELYSTSVSAGAGIAAGTYICSGAVTIGTAVYAEGEVFTKTSPFTFTGADIYAFEADVTYNFPLLYNSVASRNNIANQYVQKNCKCKDALGQKLFKIDTRLEAIRFNFEDIINTDYSGTQTMIDQISEIEQENVGC